MNGNELSLNAKFRLYNEFNNLDKLRRKKSREKKINKKCQVYLKKNWDKFIFYKNLDYNYYNDLSLMDKRLYDNSIRIFNAYRQKRLRLMKDVKKFLFENFNNCYFMTLTFEDDKLNTSFKDVKKCLSSFKFIINEDISPKDRRHYHGIISLDSSRKLAYNRLKECWKYGFVFIEKINCSSNLSAKLISKYMTKLVNHGVKKTTCNSIIRKVN